MSWLNRLVERQIEKAKARGLLSGLKGEGRPLPDRPGDAFVSAGDAAGFRIMAEAGVLPEEIVLRKQIEAAKARLAAISAPEARKAAMAELAMLEMRHAIAAEARKRFLSNG
jgi:hypothetical protein